MLVSPECWEVLSEMWLGARLKALRNCPIQPRCPMEAGVEGEPPGVEADCSSELLCCPVLEALHAHVLL